MTGKKTKVTLIGVTLARPGLEFVYEGGPCSDCETCKVRKTCHNLQPGRKYQIVAIRSNTRHDCPVHEDAAIAVDVVEGTIVALISADMAIVISKISEKYVVGEVLGNAPDICERGRSLKLVELRPV
jgi:uncharacterized protein (UPF0179 family)